MPTYSVGPGITRFEIEETHSNGFMVRLCRNGERINEFFSDGNYGGMKKAKKAAQDRYQELLKIHGPANKRPTKDLMTHRNKTGHVGVHIAHNVEKRWPGCEYYAYCASWTTEDGKREKIAFSWNRYGKELAYTLACYAREKEISDRAKIVAKFKSEIEAYQAKAKKSTGAKASKAAPAKASKKTSTKKTSAKAAPAKAAKKTAAKKAAKKTRR